MRSTNIKETVLAVVGPVEPIGCSRTDGDRYNNLQELIELATSLINEISECSEYSESHEHSVGQIGKKAKHYLINLRNALNDDFEGVGR